MAWGFGDRPGRASARASGTIAVPREPAPRGAGSLQRLWVVALVALVIAVVASPLALLGIRLFVVGSPSMGVAAPVGTLVVDMPVRISAVRVGDVVTYRPPLGGTPITHRVVSTAGGMLMTRGDANGAADPWHLRQADLIGRAAALVPGVGWLVRSLPLLLVGGALLWGGTALVARQTLRAALRVAGGAVMVSVVLTVLRPLVGVEVVSTQPTSHGAAVTVASTGMLPVAVGPVGHPAVVLRSGQLAHLLLPAGRGGVMRLASELHLGPFGWLVLALCCLLPVLWVLVVGLPINEPEQTA